MGGTKSPKLVFQPFFHKMSPKRLILLYESSETSCVTSVSVNLSMGILIRGLYTARVFIAERSGGTSDAIFSSSHIVSFEGGWQTDKLIMEICRILLGREGLQDLANVTLMITLFRV